MLYYVLLLLVHLFTEIHRALFPGVPWGPSRGSPGTLEAVKVSRAVLYRCLPIFTDFFGLSCENRVLSDDLVVGVLPEHYLVLGESEEEEVGEGWRKLEEVKAVGESLKKLENVRGSSRKFKKVRGSWRKFEKVGEG